MDDQTIVAKAAPSKPALAYLFWVTGKGRGGYARLNPEATTLGTGPRADVPFDDDLAAPEQARIRREGDDWFIYDLAGASTTLVGDQPIYRAGITDKSRITLGHSVAVFRLLG